MKTVLMMYVTLLPVILAGALNMLWCKLPVLQSIALPIDNEKNFRDGKRIFGDNKTYKGFTGYIAANLIMYVLWGILCKTLRFEHLNFFYVNYPNTVIYNIFIGELLGLAYALFDLHNSFLKRRFDVVPGKMASGAKKAVFLFLDQSDSLFGCVLVVCVFYKMSVWFYFAYVLLGALTHILVNVILYLCKLRKNMF